MPQQEEHAESLPTRKSFGSLLFLPVIFSLYNIKFTLYNIKFTLYNIKFSFTISNSHSAIPNSHSRVPNAHSTQPISHSTISEPHLKKRSVPSRQLASSTGPLASMEKLRKTTTDVCDRFPPARELRWAWCNAPVCVSTERL
jgi:hypothetical protein